MNDARLYYVRHPPPQPLLTIIGAGNPHARFDEWGLETESRLPRQPSTLLTS